MSCPCPCPSTGPACRERQSDEEGAQGSQKSARLSRVSALIKSCNFCFLICKMGIVPRAHLLPLSALMGGG